MFEFKVGAKDGEARVGELKTPHGVVKTPVFMPVGTVGVVKAVAPDDLRSIGAQIVLGNTYHLYLRPGAEIIAKSGGLQAFSSWRGPMLTDSGGFQVFSLGQERYGSGEPLAKVTDAGVVFKSHIDGSTHEFTPESVIRIQKQLGADIMMALDDVIPANVGGIEAKKALERTNLWLKRQVSIYKEEVNKDKQALFGIIQGGTDKELRRKATEEIVRHNLPGYAIGGISTGENKTPDLWPFVGYIANLLPEDKPRYLMGVGEPLTFLEAIAAGVDMMDCVLPTRLARHGAAWVIDKIKNPACRQAGQKEKCWMECLIQDKGEGWQGRRIDITRAEYREDFMPLMEGCECVCCKMYSRAALNHFARIGEPLLMRMLSVHNLNVLFTLERGSKKAIKEGKFGELINIFRRINTRRP